MITAAPDPTLNAERLAAEMARFRQEVASAPMWRYREKYVDRGTLLEPFYILDFQGLQAEPGDDLMDEPLFATSAPGLQVKHMTRQARSGSQGYWRAIDGATLAARLDRFEAMYRDGYLQPPGMREAPGGQPRPHPRFEGKPYLFRLQSPTRAIVGKGPARAAGDGAVRGVVTMSGHPLGGAVIELVLADGVTVLERRTDDQGRFWLARVPAGTHRLRVRDHALAMTLAVEAFGCVRGQVIAPDGKPAPGLRVELVAPDGERFAGTSDDTGAVALGPAPAFPLTLQVPGFLFMATVSVRLEGTIGVTVVAPDGSPLPGVELRLRRDQDEIARLTSDARGALRFEDLAGGRYTVAAPGYRLHAVRQGLAEIRGAITGASTPVSLVLMAADGSVTTAQSDWQGRFAFPAVAPGRHDLRASHLLLRRKDRS